MCGIAGFSDWPELQGGQAREAIVRMVAAMVHRGPDEQRALGLPAAGTALGAARLSLVDVAHGSQPVSNEDGSVWALLNGEIYNYRQLTEDLQKRGHVFRSRCDTEVLAHLYEEQGEEMFAALNGMFAAAVLDMRERKLLLARDHAGMKPLYYSEKQGGIAFASDIRAMLAAGLVAPEADWEELSWYFELGYIPCPGSGFRGVRKLFPGCYLRWRDGVSEIRRYWSPPRDAEPYTAEAPAALEALLRQATADHLQGDVEVGCFLSGGWDSSLVAKMAMERLGKLKTFALVMPESPRADESRHAATVAKALGTEHFEVEYRPAQLPRMLEESVWNIEEPSSCTPAVLVGLLSDLASAHVKTVVGGEGSDELFAGYDWLRPRAPYLLNAVTPSFLPRLLQPLAPDFRWRRALRQIAAPRRDDIDFEFVRRGHPDEVPYPAAVPRRSVDGADVYATVASHLGEESLDGADDPLRRRLMLEFGGRMTNGILFTSDRMSMARSLELRMPFLDRRVVEFAMRQPSGWKLAGGQEKAILKPLVERLAPAVAHRRKLGLHIPDPSLYSPAVGEYARAVLLDGNAVFAKERVEGLLRKWLDGQHRDIRFLPLLLRLQLWWNAFFAPGSPGSRLAHAENLPAGQVHWSSAGPNPNQLR